MGNLLKRIPGGLAFPFCIILACGETGLCQQDTVGTLVDVGTFTVNVPDADDWSITLDKDKGLVEFSRTKQALLSLFVPAGGATTMTVFKSRPTAELAGLWVMTEQEMAEHILVSELLSVTTTLPNRAKLVRSSIDSATIRGKKYYRLSYTVEMGNAGVTSVLHLYFPPEFPRTKEYFGFLMSEGSVKSIFTSEDLEQIAPLMHSLKTAGSASTLPGVDGELLRAAASGDPALVRRLVEGGANPNALPANGRGPLALAALFGHDSVVRYLVDRGAHLNPAKGSELHFPLTSAILGRETGIAGFLMDKGANANVLADGEWSPLIRAIAMHLDTGFVANLIAHGADPNLCQIRAPLMHAAAEGLEPVVAQLINHGATVDWQDTLGRTALWLALKRNRPEVAGILLSRGANPNATSRWGDSPLVFAAMNGDTVSLARLIERGAKINAANEGGVAALMAAADNGHKECVRLLLNKGATIDQRLVDGRTPLYLALQGKHDECALLLMERGADVNAQTALKWTPLMAAAKRGDSVAVALLLSRGATLDVENDDGDTALDIADDMDFDGIVAILRKAESRH